MDCWCPMDFIKTEITMVDFVLDNKAADVFVLVTTQSTGGGGEATQMILFGQNNFSKLKDTIRFNTPPNSTEFEQRNILLKHLKVGLIPFIAKTDAINNVSISLKASENPSPTQPDVPTKDPWNYWVYNFGVNGNFDGDKVYKGSRLSGNLSASRVTDQLKLSFSMYASKNKTTYTIEDPNGIDPTLVIVNNNDNYSINHQLVKSMSDHWSYGYFAQVSKNTFSNYQLQAMFNPAIEFNVFPYKESNNKFLTIRYGVDVRKNKYIDTTLYLKKEEVLTGQGVNVNLSLTQKWGGASVGLNYHNYFHDFNFFSLGLNGNVNVRITGGLSFNTGVYAGLARDQLNIPGQSASQQDILIRRRQVASNYNYYTYFGINYRFGSKLNNFVNPRFGNDF